MLLLHHSEKARNPFFIIFGFSAAGALFGAVYGKIYSVFLNVILLWIGISIFVCPWRGVFPR